MDMICPQCKTACINFGFFNCRCQRYRCNSCGKTFSDIPYRPLGRLKTPLKKATRIINLLVEGMGVRATATVRKLPSFDDTQIDTQTLVAGSQSVSPSVIGLKSIKVGKAIENIDGNHEESLAVTADPKNGNGGERGIRTIPIKPARGQFTK
jgi:hypothetical protein